MKGFPQLGHVFIDVVYYASFKLLISSLVAPKAEKKNEVLAN